MTGDPTRQRSTQDVAVDPGVGTRWGRVLGSAPTRPTLTERGPELESALGWDAATPASIGDYVVRPSSLLTTLLALSSLLLVACAGTGSGGSDRNGGSAWNQPPRVKTSNPGEGGPGRNRHVVLHLPATAQSAAALDLVLVDEGHEDRRSPKGRLRLALGQPQLGYKVLASNEMDALMESLRNKGLQRVIEPFQRGDERYFDEASLGAPGYRGMIYLDVDGRKTKVLGWKPRGADDKSGQERYLVFRDLKSLVLNWYRSRSASEMPQSGIAMPTAGGQ